MYSIAAMSKIKKIQLGFQYLALMQFTAYMWPKQAIVHDGDSFDFIIVGAGTAGSVIANRLTENEDIHVLLIEAGGDPPLEAVTPGYLLYLKESSYDWNFTTKYDPHARICHQRPLFQPSQGKMLGGTSSLNYMIYTRGFPEDYNTWANLTNDSTWEWKNVLPYFTKCEKIESPLKNNGSYGSKGYMELTQDDREVDDILKSFESLGNKINDDPTSGLGFYKPLLELASGIRQSSAFAYLKTAKNRKNLHVLKNTLVTKINFDKHKNAVGVEAITEDGEIITINARNEVIVSAGTFNSAKLLMLSGIGIKSHLSCKDIDVISDLPVGKNLQDHVSVVVPIALDKNENQDINPNKFLAVPTIGYTALDKSQEYPDYGTTSYKGYQNTLLDFCSFVYKYHPDICDNIHVKLHEKMAMFNLIANLNPKSRGEVKLRSDDPMVPPIINTGYFSNEDDLDNLAEYAKDFARIMNTTYFKNIKAERIDSYAGCYHCEEGSDEYWKCYVSCMFTGMNHYVGTCAMGSVVDSKLKVFGVQRLRVADASVMPTITRGYPQGPIIMIAEKAADFIKKDYNC